MTHLDDSVWSSLYSEDYCWYSFVDREILAGGPWAEFILDVLLDKYSSGRFVNIFFLPWSDSSGKRNNLSLVSFNFFCFLNLKELQSESEEDKSLEDRTENLPSTPSRFIPSDNSVKHPNYRWRNQSATEAGPDPGEKNFKVPLQSWTNKEKCRWDIIDEERDIEAIQNTDSREEENPAKSHVLTLRPLPKETAWYKKTFNPESEASTDSSPGEILETLDTVTNLLEEHQENIPFHNPHFYVARAKCVKSIPAYKDLAFPDFWGHQPPPCGKPMLERQYGVQRWLCFNIIRFWLSHFWISEEVIEQILDHLPQRDRPQSRMLSFRFYSWRKEICSPQMRTSLL